MIRDVKIVEKSNNILLGNEKSLSALVKNFNTEIIPQSLIMCGPKGIGKASFALNFAKMLLSNEQFISSEQIRILEKNSQLETSIFNCKKEYDDIAKKYKTVINIQQIRDLKEFFSLSQAQNNWRIAIIDAAEDMNESSTNALLKVLEEPPEKSIIILISHNYSSLKSTIKSRCQKIHFKPLENSEIFNLLEGHTEDSEERNLIVSLSEGLPAMALQLANSNYSKTYKQLIEIFSNLPKPIETMIFDFITSHKFESEEESGLELPDLLLILVKRLAVSNLIEEELFPNLFEQSFFDKFSFSNNSIVDLSTFYLDLEHIIVEGRKVNIDKSDLSLNCLLKAKTFFKGIVCP